MWKKIVVLTITVSLLIAVYGAHLYKETITYNIIQYISQAIETRTGWQVRLDSVTVHLPLKLQIGYGFISREDHPIMELEDAQFQISLWSLLQGNLEITRCDIVAATLLDVPPKTPPLGWQDFPSLMKIKTLTVHQFKLDNHLLMRPEMQPYREIIQNQFPLRLTFSGALESTEQNVDFLLGLSGIDQSAPTTKLKGQICQTDDNWDVDFRLMEPENGKVTGFLNAPNNYSYNVGIALSGTAEDWTDLLLQKPDSACTLKGYLHCSCSHKSLLIGYLDGSCEMSPTKGLLCEGLKGEWGRELHLDATVKVSPDGNLDDSRLNVASGDMLSDTMEYHGLQAHVKAMGNVRAPTIHAEAVLEEINSYGIRFKDVNVKGDFHNGQGNAQLHCQQDGKPIEAVLSIDCSSSEYLVTCLEAKDFTVGNQTIKNLKLSAKRFETADQLCTTLHFECQPTEAILLSGETQIDEASSHWPYKLSAFYKDALYPSEVAVSGFWHAAKKKLRVDIDEVKGTIAKNAIQMHKPASFHMNEGSVSLTPLTLTVAATTFYGAIVDQLATVRFQSEPLTLSLSCPISSPMQHSSFTIDPKAPVKGHLAYDGKLESLLELFFTDATSPFTGNVQLDLAIDGTVDNPKVHGTVDLFNGEFELLNIGASVKQLQMHGVVTDSAIQVKSLHGIGAEGGTLRGDGITYLDIEKKLPFELNLHLDRMSIDPFGYTPTVLTGPFTFKGNAEHGSITAKFTVDDLHITLPEQVPELADTVHITYVNQHPHHPPPTLYASTHSQWPLSYELEFQMPKNGVIKGTDWASEWKGHLNMTGVDGNMNLHGGCALINGEYNFNGKKFQLKEGTLTFAGDPKKTSVYVVASRDFDSIQADIILKGILRNPAIVFRSNPPLPQREILSWILFDRGSSEITPFQGSELNESISNLLKGSKKPNMLAKIRDKFGIDRIDINRKETTGFDDQNSSNVSLQVGKYITRGILLSINKSITAESNRLGIEAEVIKNVKVQAEVSDDSEAQLHLKWKRDY